MKTIKVTIEGVTPLLMNSPKSMLDEAMGVTSKTTKRDIKVDCDKLAYKMKDGTLYIPSEAIKGCLIGASSYKKFGRFTAKPIVAGGVIISPQEVSLKTKKYEMDIRTVVIQRARVVKARPKLEKWKVDFIINYDEELIPDANLIKPILEDAGKRVGLLDFRPAKNGSFGIFKITNWEESK